MFTMNLLNCIKLLYQSIIEEAAHMSRYIKLIYNNIFITLNSKIVIVGIPYSTILLK